VVIVASEAVESCKKIFFM